MKLLNVLWCLLIPLSVFASTRIELDDVVVTGQPVFDHRVSHGYAEYRFQVKNNSNQEHQVDVRLSTSGNQFNMNKTVKVDPGSRAEFSMFSNRRKTTHRLHVVLDNRQERSQMFSEVNSGYPQHRAFTSLLVSKSINVTDVMEDIEKLKGWEGTNKFSEHYMTRRTDSAPVDWSANWLAYSSFDGIVIKGSDFDGMTPNIRAALLQYVKAGGNLSLIGYIGIPFKGAPIHARNTENPDCKEYALGFGLCFIYPSETPPGSIWLKKEIPQWERTGNTFDLTTHIRNTNKKLPVVEQMSVPVRGFMLLITLFALIAGPITIFILSKLNRRIWLLWLIPLESLIACSIVLAYSFYSEGITPTVRMRGITLLDQTTHTATTLGWLGYYCPQRPSDGLLFPANLELNKVESYSWRHNTGKVDWTQSQHLKHGWIEARVPTFFMTRQNDFRRERLEFSMNADGGVEVVNGLGVEIEALWYCKANDIYYHAENLKPGQKVSLDTTQNNYKAGTSFRRLFQNEYGDLDPWKTKELPSYLTPGTYMAVLKGSPFMHHGLGERKVHLKTESLLYGILPQEVNREN